MTSRAEFLKALAECPALSFKDGYTVAGGLGSSGEYSIPALWAIQERTRQMLGDEGIEESLALGREFASELLDQPWND